MTETREIHGCCPLDCQDTCAWAAEVDPTPDPVPEPASWLMLIGGIGLLGVLYRRRL
jgi:hypothetical protein